MALHLSHPCPSFPRSNPFFTKSSPSTKLKISCLSSLHSSKCKGEYTSVMIVPTGVGATIGVFAGDALPVVRALSSVVDCLVTLPNGIDVLAGVEAVISHLVVKEFQIPCALAPALSPLPLTQLFGPKSAAEELGYTFLPCVLAGLSNTPQYMVKSSETLEKGCILSSDVDSVVLRIDACRGDGSLAFATNKRNKPLIIAVEENETILSDAPDKLGIEVVKVSNYWEAIGVNS